MKRELISGAVALGAFALLLVLASPTFRQGEPGMAGHKAPDFTFELEGRPTTLSAQTGKVVVLNFWATWCPPCVEEMPSLDRLHAQIAPLGGMVLAISVDEDAAAYQNFLQQHGIRFPTYRDPSKKISLEYGSVMYPETYIITVPKDGDRPVIQRKIIGPQDWTRPEMVEYLRYLMK